MSFIITGATGHLGRLVVESLLARGVKPADILATGRAVDKLAPLAARGVRTAAFDFNNPAEGVLTPGDTLMLISSSEVGKRAEQHGKVIEAAKKGGVARIVYTSAPRADKSTLVLAPEHKATEEMLRASGVPFTILRNGWYTENYRQAFDTAKATGELVGSAGEGRVSSAPRADYAEAAVRVLTEAGHEGKTYELGGDTAWTMAGLAEAFVKVLRRPVAYRNVSTEEHVATLKGLGLDDATAGFVAMLDKNTADGEIEVNTGDLARLLGRPTTPLLETVKGWV
jgi:NAD(P)H dehydrogenase (quinone)